MSSGCRHATTPIDERIGNLELESSSPGSVHLFQPARPPLGPSRARRTDAAHAVPHLDTHGNCVRPCSSICFDPHLYTGGDVEAVMGFSPVGVLLDDREVTQLVYDECALRLAAGIDHAAHAAGVRTFVVTGVSFRRRNHHHRRTSGQHSGQAGPKDSDDRRIRQHESRGLCHGQLDRRGDAGPIFRDDAAHAGPGTELQSTVVTQALNAKVTAAAQPALWPKPFRS